MCFPIWLDKVAVFRRLKDGRFGAVPKSLDQNDVRVDGWIAAESIHFLNSRGLK